MKKKTMAIAILALISTATMARSEPGHYEKILAGMAKLAPLAGKWNAVWKFHDKDGVTELVGTHTIKPVLDGTYLQWEVERHPKNEPGKSRAFLVFTTFNPRSNRYDQTYFYSRWALRVTETGDFDEAKAEFRTTAFIPLEDDVHDENVRTVLKFADPNHATYLHSSRYSHENSERLDLEIEMTKSGS